MFGKIASLLLFCAINSATSTKCSIPESILPCVCTDSGYNTYEFDCHLLNGTSQGFSDVKARIATAMKGKSPISLVFDDLRESGISNDLFANLNLFAVVIKNSTISKIAEGAFNHSENSLAMILIEESKLNKIPVEALSNLNKLETLLLQRSLISSISKSEIDKLPTSLKDIYLDKNCISSIESNAFAKMSNLFSLHLSHNKISTFPDGIPSRLHDLRLSENEIDHIPYHIWSKMPEEMKITLTFNKIPFIPNEAAMKQIFDRKISIKLLGNPIICDCETKWVLKYQENIHKSIGDVFCHTGSGKRSFIPLMQLTKANYSDCTSSKQIVS